jgi:hypothetical protein
MRKYTVLALDASEMFDLVECVVTRRNTDAGFRASRYGRAVIGRGNGWTVDGSTVLFAFSEQIMQNACFTLDKKGITTANKARGILEFFSGIAVKYGYGLVDSCAFSSEEIRRESNAGRGFDYDLEDTSVLMALSAINDRLSAMSNDERDVRVGLLSSDRPLVEHVVRKGTCALYAPDVARALAA